MSRNPFHSPEKCSGFTLVEMMVALAIISVILGSIYGTLISSNVAYHTQESVAETQQGLRAATDFMVREIRLAGLDPLETAGAGIEEATDTKVRITFDRDLNGVIDDDDGVSTRNEERVTYDLDGTTLRRRLYEGTPHEQNPQPMIDTITSLSLSYLDEDENGIGTPVSAANLDNIRTVVISMNNSGTDGRGASFTRTVNMRVICRNMYQ